MGQMLYITFKILFNFIHLILIQPDDSHFINKETEAQ